MALRLPEYAGNLHLSYSLRSDATSGLMSEIKTADFSAGFCAFVLLLYEKPGLAMSASREAHLECASPAHIECAAFLDEICQNPLED